MRDLRKGPQNGFVEEEDNVVHIDVLASTYARRVGRLELLKELGAPQQHIEDQERLVREALAALDAVGQRG